MVTLKLETAWHQVGQAWLSFSKWHPPTPHSAVPTFFLPVISTEWESLEEMYKNFCKEIPKIFKEPTQMEPVIFLFSNWQKADEKWTRVIAPIKVRVITPFQPQIKHFGLAEAKWKELKELYEPLTSLPEEAKPEILELKLEEWKKADWEWDRFTENEQKLASRKQPRLITPFHGRFFDWPRLEKVFKSIIFDVPKPKSNGHIKSPPLPVFEFRRWWEAERLFGIIANWQPPSPAKNGRNGATPTQFAFNSWISTDQAYRGMMIPMPTTTPDPTTSPRSLTIEEAAKAPRIHAWQSHSLTLRRGAEDWPTRRAKKNRPRQGGSMQVGRWAISTRLYEGVEERPGWYGKTKRIWITKKIPEYTQLCWPECLEQAEENPKLAEKLFGNQTKWVIQRINPAIRGRWEARNEWHEKKNGLETTEGCKKPKWMDQNEFASNMATQFGFILETEYINPTFRNLGMFGCICLISTPAANVVRSILVRQLSRFSRAPGNPDLRAKFKNPKNER